jgi:DNA mismatch endonuclease (patch repair protein)
MPATRTAFWEDKIETNRRRDLIAIERLAELGWRTLCVWECAIKGRGRLPEGALAQAIAAFVAGDEPHDEIGESLLDDPCSPEECQ